MRKLIRSGMIVGSPSECRRRRWRGAAARRSRIESGGRRRARPTPSSPSSSAPRSWPACRASSRCCGSSTTRRIGCATRPAGGSRKRGVRDRGDRQHGGASHGADRDRGAQRGRRARRDARLLDAAGAVGLSRQAARRGRRASRRRGRSATSVIRSGWPRSQTGVRLAARRRARGRRSRRCASCAPSRGEKVVTGAQPLLPLFGRRRRERAPPGGHDRRLRRGSARRSARCTTLLDGATPSPRGAQGGGLGARRDRATARRGAALTQAHERRRSAGALDGHRRARSLEVSPRARYDFRGCAPIDPRTLARARPALQASAATTARRRRRSTTSGSSSRS